jgi:hypothetical protein
MTDEEIEVLQRKVKLKRQLIQWTLNDIEDMERKIEDEIQLRNEVKNATKNKSV